MSISDEKVMQEAAHWWGLMQSPHGDADRKAFDAWCDADQRNRDAYRHLERAWDLSEGLAGSDMGRNRALPEKVSRNWATAPRLALAASVAAVALVSVSFLTRGPEAPPSAIMASFEQSKVGEIRTIALPDGSSVTLDTDSRIEILFDPTIRRVKLLRGRARFDVQEDSKRDFVVEAGGRLLSGTAARFDVQLASEGLCLQSLSGLLDVRPLTGSRAALPEFSVPAGEMALVGARGATTRPVPAGTGSERWTEGMLVFHAVPLSKVLEQTNRYSAKRISLGSQALAARRVTGAFRPLPLDELANALAAAFDLKVRREPDGNIVLEAR